MAERVSNHPGREWPAVHSQGVADWWFACDHPERPADQATLFLSDCGPCRIALETAVENPLSYWAGQRDDVAKLLLVSVGRSIVIGKKRMSPRVRQ